jgi:hypothetical protein
LIEDASALAYFVVEIETQRQSVLLLLLRVWRESAVVGC